ncbi:Hypothetical predicted protein [Cloeon dipterum]|uniref:Uncharacterized protein n=1 Tax=Cloeon dipterum TaxID=197152 RepID=A0A8S1D380_9INSE|nr:Hypothetical predicted protein [Cloeon dipterum]
MHQRSLIREQKPGRQPATYILDSFNSDRGQLTISQQTIPPGFGATAALLAVCFVNWWTDDRPFQYIHLTRTKTNIRLPRLFRSFFFADKVRYKRSDSLKLIWSRTEIQRVRLTPTHALNWLWREKGRHR